MFLPLIVSCEPQNCSGTGGENQDGSSSFNTTQIGIAKDGLEGLGGGLSEYSDKNLMAGPALDAAVDGNLSNSKLENLSRLFSKSKYGLVLGNFGNRRNTWFRAL